MNDTFDVRLAGIRDKAIVPSLNLIRGLITDANETAPTAAFPGWSADEQQAEVIDQLTLALRSVEETAMRLSKAQHAFLADDTMVVNSSNVAMTPAAAQVAPTAAPAQEDGDADSQEAAEDDAPL